MKNIGLLIGTMSGGGAERVVSHLSKILSNKYNVSVILFEDTYMDYECGGIMHNLDVPAVSGSPIVKLKLLSRRVKKLKELIKKEKLDCVISFLDSPNFVNLLAKVKGNKKIISIRNYSGLENKQSTLGKITDIAMKLIYKKADCVVTVSKLIEKDFKEHYGIKKDKITTIYNPYNFDVMEERGREPLSDIEEDFYKDHFVFCNVGRFMYQKGLWHLLKSFAKVNESYPETRLAIIGEDFTEGKLPELVKELGLEDKVLLPGRVKNPYKYMKNSAAYVLSSMFEGFPNAMVEAMACGLPIIAADCKSGPREILCEAPDLSAVCEGVELCDHGILVSPLEEEENWKAGELTAGEKNLADAMLRLIEDSELLEKYKKESISASKKYDYEACGNAFSAVIEKK